jgi:hypothetical protein
VIQIAGQTHFQFATFFPQNTSPSHDNLKKESLRVLFFTCSLAIDLVHKTDVSEGPPKQIQVARLIHSILAHSSTLHYCSIRTHSH